MRYHVRFANERVGQSMMPPFDVDTPEHFGVSNRTSDLSRKIRDRVVEALTAAPAAGADQARPVIERETNIVVMLQSGEGYAYYGTTNMGRFDIWPIP